MKLLDVCVPELLMLPPLMSNWVGARALRRYPETIALVAEAVPVTSRVYPGFVLPIPTRPVERIVTVLALDVPRYRFVAGAEVRR
jgi:hypothetical protein